MDEARKRMALSRQQDAALTEEDNHGVHTHAPLFVMDFKTWQMYRPENFFGYFADPGTVAAYTRFKPVWQRYVKLHQNEAAVLQGIYTRLEGNVDRIMDNEKLSRRYYEAYVTMSTLVDQLDKLVDRDLTYEGVWNHGYVINDRLDVNSI